MQPWPISQIRLSWGDRPILVGYRRWVLERVVSFLWDAEGRPDEPFGARRGDSKVIEGSADHNSHLRTIGEDVTTVSSPCPAPKECPLPDPYVPPVRSVPTVSRTGRLSFHGPFLVGLRPLSPNRRPSLTESTSAANLRFFLPPRDLDRQGPRSRFHPFRYRYLGGILRCHTLHHTPPPARLHGHFEPRSTSTTHAIRTHRTRRRRCWKASETVAEACHENVEGRRPWTHAVQGTPQQSTVVGNTRRSVGTAPDLRSRAIAKAS